MKKSTMVLKGLRTIVKWAHVEVYSIFCLAFNCFIVYSIWNWKIPVKPPWLVIGQV